MPVKLIHAMFGSADGACSISYTVVEPTNCTPRAIVQIAHGMSEHFGRYTEFARFLAAQGFIVCGNDHRGHGKSVRRDSAYGYIARENGWNLLIEDVAALQNLMTSRYPNLPIFLLGHSMGSLIARNLLPRYGKNYAGVILIGTAGLDMRVHIFKRLVHAISHTKGHLYRSKLLDRMLFGSYNKQIKDPATKFDWLSHDDSIVDLYIKDDKCGFIFTASGFLDLAHLAEQANKSKTFSSTPSDLPLLLLAGVEDPVGRYGKDVCQIVKNFKQAKATDVSFILYENARHEVLNEVCRNQVYQDILAWLTLHL